MAHQNGNLCRNVVDAILHGVCGGLAAFTNAPLLAQVAAIEDITAEQDCCADEDKY